MSKENGEKKKLNMANLSWGWLWGILGFLVVAMFSPVDIIPEAFLGPLGLADDAAYLAGIIKVVSEMFEKRQMEKAAQKNAEQDTEYKDVDDN